MDNFWQNVLAASFVLIIFISLSAAIYYFVAYKNIKKRRAHFEQLHQNLKVGQKVEFANGLRGTIKYVTDEVCDIEIKSGAVMSVSRYAISHLINE